MKMLARVTTKAEMEALENVLPHYVVVRVAPMLFTQNMGVRKTLPDGSVYWMDSIYFYENELGVIEAEPVLHRELPE